jgi:hypothetical protein
MVITPEAAERLCDVAVVGALAEPLMRSYKNPPDNVMPLGKLADRFASEVVPEAVKLPWTLTLPLFPIGSLITVNDPKILKLSAFVNASKGISSSYILIKYVA